MIEDIKVMKEEISGMGGDYEDCCRNMLIAGLKWLEQNPKANPKFHGFKNVYGIIYEDNEDAKALSKVVIESGGNDCSCAIYHAVIETILWIKKNGLDKYLEEMNNPHILTQPVRRDK